MNNKVYIHDKNLAYPNKEFVHMIKSEKYHDYTYDANFPYRLRGFKCLFIRFWIKVAMIILVKPICAIRYALKIKGKENIKEYFKITDTKGMISISNHTTEWDTIFVLLTRYFKFTEFPIWQEGAESKSGMLYREVGGIPMPVTSSHGMAYAYKAMRDVVKENKWLHVFPEAACWAFYPAVRTFQNGTFKLAYELNKPVLPMAVTYRAPKGIYKLFKKHPNATITIGKPIVANYELGKKEAIEDLMIRSRLSLMNLMGIANEQENEEIRNSLKTYEA